MYYFYFSKWLESINEAKQKVIQYLESTAYFSTI